MTVDWTTCRVARDCEGWLWARVGYRMWMQMDGDMRIGTEGLARFGPLVPVLDAEGLPVVQHLWNPMTNQTWCGAGERATESMAEARPRIPVCACCHIQAMHWRADHPVVATVGDLTARHIGKRVRVEGSSAMEDGVLHFIGVDRCRFEVLLDFDGREHPRAFGVWLDLDTTCEVLP